PRLVVILNQVIPEVPLPYHLASCRARPLDFDQAVDQKMRVPAQLLPPPGGEEFIAALLVPHEHKQVAVRQARDIMVRKLMFAAEGEIPAEFVFPAKLLNAPARPGSGRPGHSGYPGRAQEMTVLEQTSSHGRKAFAVPRSRDASLPIDQIGLPRLHRH